MHHVRQIRDLRRKLNLDFFTIQMEAINRKQVPLCRTHHVNLHRNALNESERELFAIGCRELTRSCSFEQDTRQ